MTTQRALRFNIIRNFLLNPLYPHAGGSDDWAKGKAGIEYSYTIELPDSGRYGFLLPAREIEPTAREAHAGVVAMIRELQRRKGAVNAYF